MLNVIFNLEFGKLTLGHIYLEVYLSKQLSRTVMCVCMCAWVRMRFFRQCPRAIQLKTEHFTENAIGVAKERRNGKVETNNIYTLSVFLLGRPFQNSATQNSCTGSFVISFSVPLTLSIFDFLLTYFAQCSRYFRAHGYTIFI